MHIENIEKEIAGANVFILKQFCSAIRASIENNNPDTAIKCIEAFIGGIEKGMGVEGSVSNKKASKS